VTGETAAISILHRDLCADSRRRIARVTEHLDLDVETIQLPEELDGYPVSHWISPAAYLRLGLDRGARGAATVVYLDCDLIAVAPIDELLAVEPDAPVAAAVDVTHPTVGSGTAIPGFVDLGIPSSRPYFNSGVMVVDMEAWQRDDVAGRCRRFLADHPEHIMYWDQDALNVVLDDRWTRLAPEDNAVVLGGMEAALRERGDDASLQMIAHAADIETRARILHFAGPLKPWSPDCPPFPARDRYLDQARLLAAFERERTRA
jgi:lipopolysaccharide biosynthesis glycosyltransferase